MRTGICTTDFEKTGVKPDCADTLFAAIRELGFECVQFAFSSIAETDFVPNGQIEIPAEIPAEAIRAADAAAARHHLPIEVINGTFNMAHPDADIRKEGLRRFALLTEAAAALGAGFISLCSGTRNPDHLWTASPHNRTPEAWQAMEDTVRRAVEMAERHGITLIIESEASNIIDTPERARQIMDTVGSPNLKMILDCANLFHPGEAKAENSRSVIRHAFELFGSDIAAAHGKDILEGSGISFCGTGLGIVDFAYTADLLRQYHFKGDMFLHGIYSVDDMPRARRHWLDCSR